MPDSLTVKMAECHLKVGTPKENYISFEISGTGKDLVANISIECGPITDEKTYLCANGKKANLTIESLPKLKFWPQPKPTAQTVSWQSSEFSLNNEQKSVTLRISNFSPESDGDARIHLKVADHDKVYHDHDHVVSIDSALGAAVLYFYVDKTRVLDEDEVTITGATTGAKTVKLYVGEAEVKPPKSSQAKTTTINTYTHVPRPPTTVYRLKAWQKAWKGVSPGESKDDVASGRFAYDDVTVAVEPREKWSSLDLLVNSLDNAIENGAPIEKGQKFYPTLLVAGKDLSGYTDDEERLYGVFVCPETKYAGLWSSSSGVDDWEWHGDVPPGMGESPGVIHNQALWLIGGSSADPLGAVSNRVWWYYKHEGKMVWKEWDQDDRERRTKAGHLPTPRSCHSCMEFNGRVWVLGGLSEHDNELNDVWTCTADPKEGKFTLTWEKSPHPLPSARCLFAVAETRKPQPRLWLYGGTTDPYNFNDTVSDLSWTQGLNQAWNSFGVPHINGEPLGAALGATLLYGSDNYLHLVGRFRGSGPAKESHFALLDESVVPPDCWGEISPAPELKWVTPQTDLFRIGSVAFGDRWIFWPVYQYMFRKINEKTNEKTTNYKTAMFTAKAR